MRCPSMQLFTYQGPLCTSVPPTLTEQCVPGYSTLKFAKISGEYKYSRGIDMSAFHAPTARLHTADGVSIPPKVS